jgi:hypothetical protein
MIPNTLSQIASTLSLLSLIIILINLYNFILSIPTYIHISIAYLPIIYSTTLAILTRIIGIAKRACHLARYGYARDHLVTFDPRDEVFASMTLCLGIIFAMIFILCSMFVAADIVVRAHTDTVFSLLGGAALYRTRRWHVHY